MSAPSHAVARWLSLWSLIGVSCTSHVESKPKEPCRAVVGDGVPCGDFGNLLGTTDALFVTGRAVTEEPGFDARTVAPEHDASQEELPDLALRLLLRSDAGGQSVEVSGRTDDEGWLAERYDLRGYGLGPGSYSLEVWAGDSYLSKVGVRLLPPDHEGVVVLSDIDLTYLDTDFQSAAALAELLTQSAEEREVLPGMPAAYRALRRGTDADGDVPLVYLSGSPLFFRRVLSARTELDEIEQDGILLKPTNLLLTHELLSGLDGGALDALLGGENWLGSLTDQLGYKLTALFAEQSKLPVTARLLLLGDDSETDHVTYALFHRTLSGELAAEDLLDTLDELGVDDLWRDAIERLAPSAVELRDPPASPVAGIFINLTEVPNIEEPASEWVVPELTVLHRGSAALMDALAAGGWVEP